MRVWWFNEFSIYEQIIFDKIIKICEKFYKQFWYYHIHTPAVERNDVLLAKSWTDAAKQIFWLYWLAQWVNDVKDYSLHFDLTIPFARYVLDHENELKFPFKRYQIQTVRRWERQQKWRFKEFYQSDIDVIWKNDWLSDFLYYDSEVIFVWYLILLEIKKLLWLEDEIIVNINNRKIILWLIEWILWKDFIRINDFLNLLDKFYKISNQEFIDWLIDIWVENKKIDTVLEILNLKLTFETIWQLDKYFSNQNFKDWINQLSIILKNILLFSKLYWINFNYNINLFIVRWLDYYTWTVFETFLSKNRDIWSIYSWWRYDGLTSFIDTKKNYSGVWSSIWVDRFLSLLWDLNLNINEFDERYLFINFDETYKNILDVFKQFFDKWKICEIYPNATKIKKQLDFANKKNIKYVVILWPDELEKQVYIIKDLVSWQEKVFWI